MSFRQRCRKRRSERRRWRLGVSSTAVFNDIKLDRGRKSLASRDEDWRILWR